MRFFFAKYRAEHTLDSYEIHFPRGCFARNRLGARDEVIGFGRGSDFSGL